MKRHYVVTMTTVVELEIDDEAVSDSFDGETILTAHNNPERFQPGATRDDVLMSLAVAVGVDNRRLPSVDGWADFPAHAAESIGWPDYYVDNVREISA